MLDEYDALLTVQELREILNVGRGSAYELLKQGEIPAFRIGKNKVWIPSSYIFLCR